MTLSTVRLPPSRENIRYHTGDRRWPWSFDDYGMTPKLVSDPQADPSCRFVGISLIGPARSGCFGRKTRHTENAGSRRPLSGMPTIQTKLRPGHFPSTESRPPAVRVGGYPGVGLNRGRIVPIYAAGFRHSPRPLRAECPRGRGVIREGTCRAQVLATPSKGDKPRK